ncbi:hypothetical protein ABPG77_000187 [Micractinium sp. CCAP 211/92]
MLAAKVAGGVGNVRHVKLDGIRRTGRLSKGTALQALQRDEGPLMRWLPPPSPPAFLRPDVAVLPAAAALLLLAGAPQLGEHAQLTAQQAQSSAVTMAGGSAMQLGPADLVVASSPGLLGEPEQQQEQKQQPPMGPRGKDQQREQQEQHAQSRAPASAAAGSERPLVMDSRTLAALGLCMAVAALANSAGVGGGAFVVPLLYLGLGFDIKQSTALSQAVIAGGALGAVACVLPERHPLDSRRPLVDYQLALVITPPLLLGCTSGVLLNQLMPGWAVTLLLIPLLTHLTWRTAGTAAKLRLAEDAARRAGQLAAEGAPPALAVLQAGAGTAAGDAASAAAALGPLCPSPWPQARDLLALWAVLLGFQMGKRAFPHCTWQFAALYGGQAAAALAACAYFIWQIARAQEDCGCCGDGTQEPALAAATPEAALPGSAGADSSTWPPQRLASSAAVALAGGTVAGMLGIGGGMIVGPLMLELGVQPRVASATASMTVLFSASSAAASFALEGRLNLPHAAAFGAACAAAAYVGVALVGGAVRASGRSSLVVVLLTVVIGTGAALTAVFSGADALADLLAGGGGGGTSFCGG